MHVILALCAAILPATVSRRTGSSFRKIVDDFNAFVQFEDL